MSDKIRNPKVKVCCIQSVEEANLAIQAGASAIGLVSAMPSGPGVISDELIATIAKKIPPGIETFLLTSKQDVDDIIKQHNSCRTTTIQFVDTIPPEAYEILHRELPQIKLVQVIHVTGQGSIEKAKRFASYVDAILLDSGNPDLVIKELGGTGRTHNWDISYEICRSVDTPVYLAGGLNPENVTQAIEHVNPFGLDICSGLRTDGKLDKYKLTLFFDRIHHLIQS